MRRDVPKLFGHTTVHINCHWHSSTLHSTVKRHASVLKVSDPSIQVATLVKSVFPVALRQLTPNARLTFLGDFHMVCQPLGHNINCCFHVKDIMNSFDLNLKVDQCNGLVFCPKSLNHQFILLLLSRFHYHTPVKV